MKKFRQNIFNIVCGALLVNLVWYACASILKIKALVDPITVYCRLGSVWQQSMSEHLFASLFRVGVGVGIVILLGLSITILMVRYRHLGKLISALVYFLYPIPKLALLPVVMLLAGIGDASKIIMIVLIILFQVIVNLRDSMRLIPRDNFAIIISLGARYRQRLIHVVFPALLPELLSTIRVAIGTAISVLFVTETYGTEKGMGYFIVDAWMRMNYVDMYAGIVILSIMGFFLFVFIDFLEMILCTWKTK